ncbi:hypothetical protein [Exiguobacterium sp. s7]|uniref:hypothetical protein n=1 Tax=Exiguobacterium sp. s7 TaxID=2751235 RepID=UPI001BEB6D4A|nr:hypothetical protein [Exiguobacterium sp. s7]
MFQIDEANKRRFLQNYLQEHHALSDSSYSSHASITQFGTMFHVTLVDEPDIMYDFFVKRRDGVMHVVYRICERESPLLQWWDERELDFGVPLVGISEINTCDLIPRKCIA